MTMGQSWTADGGASDDRDYGEVGGAVEKLTRDIDAAIQTLNRLPIGVAGGDENSADDLNAIEAGMVRLRGAVRKTDLVFAEYANAVVLNDLNKRDGGRATPRSYLKRLLDITDSEVRNLLALRDVLHPEPDPDPPPDATPDEIAAAEVQLLRRKAIGDRLTSSARRGNFPVCKSAQMTGVLESFNGQEAGLLEDVAEAIADHVDSTPAHLFRSMCAAEARKHLEKRREPTKAGASRAMLTVSAPDIDGLCKVDARLPAPTAAVLNALLQLNSGPGTFLDLPEGVKDPRTLHQRRVHALHHILLGTLQNSADGETGGLSNEGHGKRCGSPPGDEEQGLLRWLRTDSAFWDPDQCPYVADLFSGKAKPLARPNPGVASVVVAIRASEMDEELSIMGPEPAPDGRGSEADCPTSRGSSPNGKNPGGHDEAHHSKEPSELSGQDWEEKRGLVSDEGQPDDMCEAEMDEGRAGDNSELSLGGNGDGGQWNREAPCAGCGSSPAVERGVGFRRFPTNTGIDLTLPELASLGAHKFAWLALLDDITGRPLDLGRSRRTADLWQRMLLLAAETVCTYPGCEQPAGSCQTHHIDAWFLGGATDLGNCTLRCPEHHRENDDEDAGDSSGRATLPAETGRVGHVKPGEGPKFNDSPAARRSPGWSDTWWATYQSELRENKSCDVTWKGMSL